MTEERQLFITPKKFYALLSWEHRWNRLKDWACKQQDMPLIHKMLELEEDYDIWRDNLNEMLDKMRKDEERSYGSRLW
jgi:hypothetical protein